MNTKQSFFRLFTTSFLFCLFANLHFADAQIILPNHSDEIPEAYVGVPYTSSGGAIFRFFLSNGELNPSWRAEAVAPSVTLPPGLTLQPDGRLIGTPTVPMTYYFKVFVTPILLGTEIESSVCTLSVASGAPSECHPARFTLLIDRSGSMNELTASGQEKWEVLKRTIGIYLPVVTGYTSSADHLNVLFFNNNLVTPGPSTTFDQPWMSNANNVVSNIFGATTPTGGTPLGPGLQQAMTTLAATSATDAVQSVLILTDGMQNQGVEVSDDGSGIPGTGINFSNPPYDQMKILTIGVGATAGFRTMLQNLAKPDYGYAQIDEISEELFTGGIVGEEDSNDDTDDYGRPQPSELRAMFYGTLPAILRYCSPRILDFRAKRTKGTGEEHTETFSVNRLVKSLTIQIVPNRTKLGNLRLFKDGVLLHTQPQWDGYSLLYHIKFPYSMPGDSLLRPAGKWEVKFQSLEQGKYDIVAMVDDKQLKTDFGIGKPANSIDADNPIFNNLSYNNVNVGDPINLRAKVSFLGLPFESATVEAFLLRPGDDLGDLASAADIAAKDLDPAEVGTPIGQAKIDSLMRDSAFIAKLKKTIQPSPMTHVGNGIYATSFDNNTVTGTYRAVVRFKGTLPGGGDFEGWETKCILVDFGEPDDINLNATQVYVNKLGRGGPYTVKFTPTNRFNRKLGPGQTNRIKVQLQPGGPVNVIDNLDGSYTINKTFGPNENPNIQVNVIDSKTPVYSGSLFGFAGRKWYVSAHAGLALPASKFDSTTYKNGYFAEIDLGRMLSRQFYLEAIGGYYNFGSQKSILGGSLYAGFLPTIGNSGLKLNLAVGGGYFKPKNEDGELGVSGRAGIRQQLTAKLDVCLDGAYFYLPDTERAFATVGLGIKYFF